MDGSCSIPSLSSGSVGSRFVSQTDLEKAKANREEQWRAAYARLGQEPPPRPQEDAEYDGRSLYERLQSQKDAKQEKWDDEHKLSKQFRALEEDEILFLDAIMEEKREKEKSTKDQDSDEVASFKEAVAAREQALNAAPPVYGAPSVTSSSSKPTLPQRKSSSSGPSTSVSPSTSSTKITTAASTSAPPKPTPTKQSSLGKKDQKSLLKGVIKKKAPTASTTSTTSSAAAPKPAPASTPGSSDKSSTSSSTKRALEPDALTEGEKSKKPRKGDAKEAS